MRPDDAIVNVRFTILGLANALEDDEFNSAAREVLDEIARHNHSGGDRRCKCFVCKASFTARKPASGLVVFQRKASRFGGAICRQCLAAGNLRERVIEAIEATEATGVLEAIEAIEVTGVLEVLEVIEVIEATEVLEVTYVRPVMRDGQKYDA